MQPDTDPSAEPPHKNLNDFSSTGDFVSCIKSHEMAAILGGAVRNLIPILSHPG